MAAARGPRRPGTGRQGIYTKFRLPAECGGAIEYESTDDCSALLMCDDDVEFNEYDARGLFMNWLRDNATTIRKKHKQKFGNSPVHAFTGTYQTAQRTCSRYLRKPAKRQLSASKAARPVVGNVHQSTTYLD